jgi:hypothetical protein
VEQKISLASSLHLDAWQHIYKLPVNQLSFFLY